MDIISIASLIVNGVLGGGLLVTLVTLKSQRVKAREDARSVSIANEDSVNRMVNEYFVEPLKKEITSLRREVSRLRRSIERIPECPHSQNCPVKETLNEDTEPNNSGDGVEQ